MDPCVPFLDIDVKIGHTFSGYFLYNNTIPISKYNYIDKYFLTLYINNKSIEINSSVNFALSEVEYFKIGSYVSC